MGQEDVKRRHIVEGMRRREERLRRLRTMVTEAGPVRLAQAARDLDVSGMTLRRDLAQPASGLDLLGGHVMAQPGGYTLDRERDSHATAKEEAGRLAAAMVAPGDTIFVDCGTTTPYLIAALPSDLHVTIICYALNIAAAVSRKANAQLFLLGGLYHGASETFLSEAALGGLDGLGIAKAFVSAGGVHERHGVTCSNFNEVPVKRAVMARAQSAFLVVDRSKLGQVKPARFADCTQFNRVVCDGDAPRA